MKPWLHRQILNILFVEIASALSRLLSCVQLQLIHGKVAKLQTESVWRVSLQLPANEGLKDMEWAGAAATATWPVHSTSGHIRPRLEALGTKTMCYEDFSETPDWERFGRALIA